jgi:hypothetical protein
MPGQARYLSVKTMGLEPTAPCLQIRPTCTAANSDGRLRLVRGTIRTPANRRERLRALPFCYFVSVMTCMQSGPPRYGPLQALHRRSRASRQLVLPACNRRFPN